ncbi:MAG: efflux RND transporter periplasmic adaptor subunit [Planctomycetes bacterium]|nr:efflux RND transporter periplasmic adaptor subunit [Planctomycetota bacterium]
MTRGPTWRWGVPLALALGAGTLGLVLGRGGSGPEGQPWTVRRVSLERDVTATGTVQPWRQVEVAAKVDGRLAEVPVEVGQRVEEGQVLARLEAADLTARRDAARAEAEGARLRHEDVRGLRQAGLASRAELDLARTTAEAAAARLAYGDRVLADAVIRSPLAGVVVRRHREAGESVTTLGSPMPIVTVADRSRLKVVAQVQEMDIAGLVPGLAATVHAEAWEGEVFPGRVWRVGERVEMRSEKTGDPREISDVKVLDVEVELDHPDGRLPLRLTVDVRIQVLRAEAVLAVPRGALRGQAVLAHRDGTWREVPVRTGVSDRSYWEVLDGLQEGDRVLVESP